MSKPLTHEQISKIIELFKKGGNNTTKTISTELGFSYWQTNKVLNNYLEDKKAKL